MIAEAGRLVQPAVRAARLAYRYGEISGELRPVDLAVLPGEFWLVSGPSGSGKSTLARCLTGLIPHLYRGTLAGQVWVDGMDTRETPLWRLAERAGLVFQNPASQMLAATVEDEIIFGLENLGLERAEIGRRVESVLRAFGLTGLRGRAPQTLSGGEQQKLALAAILARRPALIVLDEPLSMLDSTAAIELIGHLQHLAHDDGAAVVMVEHRGEYLRQVPALHEHALPPMGAPGPTAVAGAMPVEPATSDDPALSHSGGDAFELNVRDLTVRHGGRAILHRVSFDAAAGEVIAVVGRNGSGKTTLLRSLAGLQSADGSVQVAGGRPDFGLVFQNAELQLFNATVRDEILYRIPRPNLAWYDWLVAALGLAPYEQTPPLLLSEGEKKRVALGAILMRRPHHGVLLDEPSLGQDARHKAILMRLARGLAAAGHLVVFTTHDLALAGQADRVILLHEGKIVADDAPAAVLGQTSAWQRAGLVVPAWLGSPEQLS
jgi:energy-coupling factor transport system ATP-binding protein